MRAMWIICVSCKRRRSLYLVKSFFSSISEALLSRLCTMKQPALYSSCTTCPTLVFDAFGYCFFSMCTTYKTSVLRAIRVTVFKQWRISFSTSSCIWGPRNWQPLFRISSHSFDVGLDELTDGCPLKLAGFV